MYFNSGTTTDLFGQAISGDWSIADGRYNGTAAAGAPAINSTSLIVSPSSFIDLSATLRFVGEGGFIFDQYDAENVKFVTISAGKVTIGHRTSRGWFIDATDNNPSITAGTDYTLGLTLKGTTVSVTLNGQPVFSHMYNALVTDGLFGVFSRTGTTSFDRFTAGHG